MSAMNILNRVKEIEKEIQIKQNLAMSYRQIAEGLQSPQYSDMPKSPNLKRDPMADALNKAMDLEEEVKKLEKEIVSVKSTIFQVIQLVENKEQQLILLERYIHEEQWRNIIPKLNYCRSRVFELHNDAIVSFYRAYDNFGLEWTSVDSSGR